MFEEKDIERYSRQLLLPEIGPRGQDRLSRARVLVIGAGGLGSPLLFYLSGSGIGNITVVDHDSVHISNLHRQTLYRTDQVDQLKAEAAVSNLHKLNPEIKLTAISERFTRENATDLIKTHDLVVDCSDSIETRYLIDEFCVLLNKPLVFGAIHRYEGQFGLLNHRSGPTYRCFFPENNGKIDQQTCAETGVLGPLCGLIASFQADLVIRYFIEDPELPNNEIGVLTTRNYSLRILKATRKEHSYTSSGMKRISPQDFFALDKTRVTIIDVREEDEEPILSDYERKLIPLNEIPHRLDEIPQSGDVYVICASGSRSQSAIDFLSSKGYQNLINVDGGTYGFIQQKERNE